jgi:hypothetical protein
MWFPAGPSGVPVSMHVSGRICSSTVPRRISLRSGSVFHRADSPSEFLHLHRRSALSFGAATYLGFRPPPDITAQLPICGTFHSAAGAHPGVLNRSWLSQRSLRACFISQPGPGRFLVQGSVLSVQPSSFVSSVPPLPFSLRALTCKQAATHTRLDSDVLLHTKPLASRIGVSLPGGLRPSSSFMLLQVHRIPAKPVPCLRTLMPLPSKDGSPSAHFQCPTWKLCCHRFRPARAFRTFHTNLSKSWERGSRAVD